MMINDKDKLDLTREFEAIRKGKTLYIVSVTLAILLSAFYAIFSSPVYHNEGVFMIEDESGPSGISNLLGGNQMANLFSLSGLGSSTLDDELVILRSHDCFKLAVSNLGTNRTYSERVGLHKLSLYGKSPVLVEAPKAFFDTLSTALKFSIKLTGNGCAQVKISKGFMGLSTITETTSLPLPFQLQTAYGSFQFLKTDYYVDSQEQVGRKINVQLSCNDYAAEAFQKLIEVKEVNKKSNAVEIDFDIADPDYGRDMIGSLITSYRMMRRDHKADQSAAKLRFLDKRIEILSNQLDTAQVGIQDYMKEYDIVNVDAQTSLLLRKTMAVNDSIFSLRTQLMINEAILKLLQDPDNQYQLLAQDSKMPLVNSYNELILQRTEMLQSAKVGNVMLVNLEKQINEMRSIVIDYSNQNIKHCKMVIDALTHHLGSESQVLGTMPTRKIEMQNIQRNLSLQNNLLIYLLQERENALLSLNSEDDAGFVVDKPFTAKKTIKKKMITVSILLLLFSVICPTAWILFRKPRKKTKDLLIETNN